MRPFLFAAIILTAAVVWSAGFALLAIPVVGLVLPAASFGPVPAVTIGGVIGVLAGTAFAAKFGSDLNGR